jgi:hypothetical protein
MDDALLVADTARTGTAAFEHKVLVLQERQVSMRDFDVLLDAVLPVTDAKARTANEIVRARGAVRSLFDSPLTEGFAGTGWAFVQAVNSYEQWSAPVRKTKGVGSETVRTVQFDIPARVIAINASCVNTAVNGALPVGVNPRDCFLFRVEYTTGDRLHIAPRLGSTVVGKPSLTTTTTKRLTLIPTPTLPQPHLPLCVALSVLLRSPPPITATPTPPITLNGPLPTSRAAFLSLPILATNIFSSLSTVALSTTTL